jgi:hypothetical protein
VQHCEVRKIITPFWKTWYSLRNNTKKCNYNRPILEGKIFVGLCDL